MFNLYPNLDTAVSEMTCTTYEITLLKGQARSYGAGISPHLLFYQCTNCKLTLVGEYIAKTCTLETKRLDIRERTNQVRKIQKLLPVVSFISCCDCSRISTKHTESAEHVSNSPWTAHSINELASHFQHPLPVVASDLDTETFGVITIR